MDDVDNKLKDAFIGDKRPRHYADEALQQGDKEKIIAWIESNVPESWRRLVWAHVKVMKRKACETKK